MTLTRQPLKSISRTFLLSSGDEWKQQLGWVSGELKANILSFKTVKPQIIHTHSQIWIILVVSSALNRHKETELRDESCEMFMMNFSLFLFPSF